MSRAHRYLAVLVLVATTLGLSAVSAGARTPRNCNSADLRYPFSAGGPRAFGVFKLHIANGSCATAHRVAKSWMARFEAAFRAGHLVLPREAGGFTFRASPAHVPQTYHARGRG